MKVKGNVALIVLSIFAGTLVILGLAIFLKKDEVVTLPITVYEYADFECPACGYYYPMVEDAVNSFNSDNVKFEFKHFPLTTIHKYAYNAALASEAAREQGKFTQYADLLMEKNRAYYVSDKSVHYLTDNNLVQYAVDLGLDKAKFITDMQGPVVKARVDADIADANAKAIGGTPTFYINGKQFRIQSVDANLNEEQVKQAITKQFSDYINTKLELAKSQNGAVAN